MANKKSSASAKKELKTTVKELRFKLHQAERTAKRSKTKVARLKKANTELEAEVKDLKKSNKRLRQTPPPAEPLPLGTSTDFSPDDSWTVTQLRAEARARGLTGLSRKTKAELLATLG